MPDVDVYSEELDDFVQPGSHDLQLPDGPRGGPQNTSLRISSGSVGVHLGGCTDSLNKNKKESRARERSPEGARTRAKKVQPKADDPHVWVKAGTRWWKNLAAYYAALGKPEKMFVYPGTGEHAGSTGRPFRQHVLIAAGCVGHSRGPPLDDEQSADSSVDSDDFVDFVNEDNADVGSGELEASL
jgi:hypothetical protein